MRCISSSSSMSSLLVAVAFAVLLLAVPSPTSGQSCSDVAPPGQSGGAAPYTCAEQVAWGKCGEAWMRGYCLKSCFNCASPPTCSDVPPPASPGSEQFTCAQQKSWGKCGESFMQGYCQETCFSCGQTYTPTTPPAAGPPGSACTDTPPAGDGYSCQQQKEWGKCSESWMQGFCAQTCFNCEANTEGNTGGGTGSGSGSGSGSSTCTDQPPAPSPGQPQYTCAEQKAWGQCGASWMVGFCAQSCFHCATTPAVPPPNVPTTGSTASGPITEALRLRVVGSRFQTAAGTRIFLNGVNQAWNNYAYDFGQGMYNPGVLHRTVDEVHAAGGNLVRMWLHCDASGSPTWNSQGMVSGLSDAFLSDLTRYVEYARTKGVYVILSLMDFLIVRSHGGLFNDEAVRNSYVRNALTSMVTALQSKPNLLWEIFNEPEGSTGQWGWQDPKVSMAAVQAATNHYSHAIHSAHAAALVTVGWWSWKAVNEGQWTDAALVKAGGYAKGTLDFWQVHYYQWQGRGELSSFDNPRDWFGKGKVGPIDRPVVIGELSQSGSDMQIRDMYRRAFNGGWDGAAGWQANGGGQHADTLATLLNSVAAAASAAQGYVQPADGGLIPVPDDDQLPGSGNSTATGGADVDDDADNEEDGVSSATGLDASPAIMAGLWALVAMMAVFVSARTC